MGRAVFSGVAAVVISALTLLAGTAGAQPRTRYRIIQPRILTGHTDGIHAVTFFPDGSRVVSASHDKTVRVWDVASGKCLLTLEGHEGPVWCVDVSPDGKLIASAGDDLVPRVWDANTGEELAQLPGHTRSIRGIGFLADNTLVTGAKRGDGTVRVWDVKHEKELYRLPTDDCVLTMTFDQSRSRMAFGGCDGFVKVWDMTRREQLAKFERAPASSNRMVKCLALVAGGKRVAYVASAQELRYFDVDARQNVAGEPRGPVHAVEGFAVRADGDLVLSMRGGLYDGHTGMITDRLAQLTDDASVGNCGAFSADGRWAAFGEGGTLRGEAEWTPGKLNYVLLYDLQAPKAPADPPKVPAPPK